MIWYYIKLIRFKSWHKLVFFYWLMKARIKKALDLVPYGLFTVPNPVRYSMDYTVRPVWPDRTAETQMNPWWSFVWTWVKGRIIIICCIQISSSDEDSRLSGILPTQMTRSQVAKFRLDHHKMIYKEKRRMSMPGTFKIHVLIKTIKKL